MQDWSNSSALTLELLQYCTEPLMCWQSLGYNIITMEISVTVNEW